VNDIERKLNRDEIIAPGDAPMYVCRARVFFDGSTTPPTIRNSGNVSSVVRTAPGYFRVNFTTPLPEEFWTGVVQYRRVTTWVSTGVHIVSRGTDYALIATIENNAAINPAAVDLVVFY
jgi:hypothetical protein